MLTTRDCCTYLCLVYLHSFLEPAVGAVDPAPVAVYHLLRKTHIAAMWSVRDRGATLRTAEQRLRGSAVQTEHEDTALDRVQVLLVRLI